jgi:hypothetical protein
MKILRIAPVLLCASLLVGCATSSRWQIHQTRMGFEGPNKANTLSENTILLDATTGKTWLLWPNRDNGSQYGWVEIPRIVKQ